MNGKTKCRNLKIMVQCNLLFQFIFFSFHLGFPRVHCTSCLWFVVANFWQKKRTGNQSLTSFGTASKIQCHIFSMLASSKETNQIITVFYWKVDIATPLYQSIKIDMHRTWEDSGHLFHSPPFCQRIQVRSKLSSLVDAVGITQGEPDLVGHFQPSRK